MTATIENRIRSLNWAYIEKDLDEWGFARTGPILTASECTKLIDMYSDEKIFRSTINMKRYRFGEGEYKYFADPSPALIRELRNASYRPLAPIANRWIEHLNTSERYPTTLEEFLKVCAKHNQKKPTPLLLHYEPGDYNCLHQDIYGEVAFPLQLTCVLNRPGVDFTGGEFLLMEQRPRAQSRAEVIVAEAGEFVIFPNRYRPVAGNRGYYRTNMKHGVSRVRSGSRYAMGIIFHDAA